MTPTMRQTLRERRVVVCGGSGGVGKTTTSTAIALAAARSGRRVLALTVDPSRRLAQTLGVSSHVTEPVPVPDERLDAAGIPRGHLHAWMLDPKVVADRFVQRFAADDQQAQRLMNNRIYRQISRMVAGMHEYTAMEALATFVREGRYDLVVLDTPPSRNALDFLYGPSRLSGFLDSGVFQLFMGSEEGKGFFRRAASRLARGVNSAVFGETYAAELTEFFDSFQGILRSMNRSAVDGFQSLKDPERVAFLLVTSPATEALTDAFFFRRKTAELGLPFRGFVLNRSQASGEERQFPTDDLFGPNPSAVERSALRKLQDLARLEVAAIERDRALLDTLRSEAGDDAFAVALPALGGGAEGLADLLALADALDAC